MSPERTAYLLRGKPPNHPSRIRRPQAALALRSKAADALQARIDAAGAVGSARLLDVRHEFPTEWARFTTSVPSGQPATAPLTLTLREEHYPYWSRLAADRELWSVEFFASAGSGDVAVYDAPADNPPGTRHETVLRSDLTVGNLRSGMLAAPLPSPIGELTLYIDDRNLTDLWIILVWGTGTRTTT